MKGKSAARSRSRSTRTTASYKTRTCGMPRPGQRCPQCRKGKLGYDGLLNLVCLQCGQVAFSGGFA